MDVHRLSYNNVKSVTEKNVLSCPLKAAWHDVLRMGIMFAWLLYTEANDPAGEVYRRPTDRLRFSDVPPRASQYRCLDASLPGTRGYPRYETTATI